MIWAGIFLLPADLPTQKHPGQMLRGFFGKGKSVVYLTEML